MLTLIILVVMVVVVYIGYKVIVKKETIKAAVDETKSDVLNKIKPKK